MDIIKIIVAGFCLGDGCENGEPSQPRGTLRFSCLRSLWNFLRPMSKETLKGKTGIEAGVCSLQLCQAPKTTLATR